MSTSVDPTLRNLNDCGCCEGISPETPLSVSNRPGLSAIAYRAGTHAQFKESMLARLSGLRLPSLQGLTSRYDDDFSIALLDAFATVADVLTFYQERIANEAYLRTATERRSVLELARLIDYQLRPGVAANTYLSFTVEDAPGALGQAFSLGSTAQIAPESSQPIIVATGIKVQSIPGPGEQAQTFETVEEIEARPEWNAIKPRLTTRHPINADATVLLFNGLATGLKRGDGLVLFPDDDSEPVLRIAGDVTLENEQQRTRVQLQPVTPAAPPASSFTPSFANRAQARPSATTARFLNTSINSSDFFALGLIEGFVIDDVFTNLTAIQPPPPSVFVMRARAGIFGHNAPRWSTLPVILRIGEYAAKPGAAESPTPPLVFTAGPFAGRVNDWAEQNLASYPDPENQEPANTTNIYLDNVISTITKESWVALKDGSNSKVYQVSDVAEVSKSDFTLTAKVSRLTLNSRVGFESFKIRGTTVFGQSEELELARLPIESEVSGLTIDLDGWVVGLEAGKKIILCGERSDQLGVRACEVATIETVTQIVEIDGYTRITLSSELTNSYVRETLIINANVALATHGETVKSDPNAWGEVMGNGDAAQSFQRFTLRQPPLTYTSASNPSGAETTLKVRVNDILWREVASFFGYSPEDRIYVTRTDDDGKTTVIFGDGKTGTRLPTGQQNIQAKYRKGIGLAGLVRADQLTLLMTRTLGLKSVTNPIASSAAADPEKLDDARRNAPLTILTLDRVVSIQDYEDFARAFSGIGKALATWTWFGQARGIFLTIAGVNGATVDDDLSDRLLTATRKVGDPTVAIAIESYRPRFFRIKGSVRINPDYLPEKVLAEIEQRLRDGFSFEARAFGQPLHLSEIMLVIQSVEGVVSVDIDEMYRTGEQARPNSRIEAAFPRPGDEQVQAAELLTLDPSPLELEVLL
jgi:predicted phage baseplate assembly protein